MSESIFEFPELLSRIAHLRTRLIAILESSDASKIKALASEVPVLRSTGNDAPPLTVTFVGQYNAGKSTIISALTGKRDIPIDTGHLYRHGDRLRLAGHSSVGYSGNSCRIP